MAINTPLQPGRSAVTPSVAVVEAVAAEAGVDPLELDRPLNEVIDPDALDRLVAPDDARPDGDPCEVSFSYYGHEVTVSSTGTVRVAGDAATLSP